MADEKKPKIDLKARLGKTAAPAQAPAPLPSVPQVTPSGRPLPMPTPGVPFASPGSAGLPSPSPGPGPGPGPGLPVPDARASYGASPGGLGGGLAAPLSSRPAGLPGGLPIPGPSPFAPSAFSSGPHASFDPSNPLAAAVHSPYLGNSPANARIPAPEPQRIEFDDLTLQQASKNARKQGIIIGAVFAVILGGVGYVAGGASEQASSRTNAKAGAVDLANNATKARDKLKELADKMDAGRKQLVTDHKFPMTLASELGAINVDFDGKQLEGRRFSGFSTDTTRDLVEFITAVQATNDRKMLIQKLLTELQKPITEQLAIPEGQIKINYVVAVDKDPAGNVAAFLSHLAEPIAVTGQSVALPKDFTFSNPGGSGNTSLPRFTSGDIGNKPAAMYVVPKTFDTVCPSAKGGQIAQLGAQIGNFIADLKGEPAGDTNTVSDAKPGMVERADKLVKELGTVGG